MSPPSFFFLFTFYIYSLSPEITKNCWMSFADCPGPIPALFAVCAPVSLSFVSGPLAWWPEWLSGSSVPRALACSPPRPSFLGLGLGLLGRSSGKAEAAAPLWPSAFQSMRSSLDWLRLWGSGWTGAHTLSRGFEFRFKAPARQRFRVPPVLDLVQGPQPCWLFSGVVAF